MNSEKSKRRTREGTKKRILDMLNLVELEVEEYKQTGDELWLCQASEKAWVAYVSFVEYLLRQTIRSRERIHIESVKLSVENRIKNSTYQTASFLHKYHYQGWDPDIVVMDAIKSVVSDLRGHLGVRVEKPVKVDRSKEIRSKKGRIFRRDKHSRRKPRR